MLKYIYSTVNAGKSANLLMRTHSCHERSITYLTFVPEVAKARDGKALISSRIGFKLEAISLSKEDCPLKIILEKGMQGFSFQVVFVDEAQFLTKEQVRSLCRIADELEVPVFAYGLRTDFKGEPFEGSQYLLSWADMIEEIATFEPGSVRKATFNLKVDEEGNPVKTGDPISPGFHYLPVSRRTFNRS
jgi:thymidine kinase